MPNEFDLVAKILADTKELKKALEKEIPDAAGDSGERAGRGFSKGFNTAIKAIAGAAVFAKITQSISKSIDTAARFEKSFVSLNAAARQFGRDQEDVRKKVLSLADDGAIGLETLSKNFRVLLSLGKTAEQSFQILDAAKRVGTLNNVIGGPDGVNQALDGFVKFLATGESELADNLDPTLKKVAKDLGGYTKVADDAATQQKFLNAVIEKGAALQGDYNTFINSGAGGVQQLSTQTERLSATIGSALLKVLDPLIQLLTKGVAATREFFEGLSGAAQSSTIAGAGITLLGLAITTVLLPALATLGVALPAAFGPIGIVIAAVAAGVTALIAVFDTLIVTNDELVDAAKESADEYAALNDQFGKTSKAADDLIDINGELAKSARALGVAIRFENGQLLTNEEALKKVQTQKIANLKADRAKLLLQRQETQKVIGLRAIQPGTQTDELPQIFRPVRRQFERGAVTPELRGAIENFDRLETSIRDIDKQIQNIQNPPKAKDPGGFKRTTKAAKKAKKEIEELERSSALIRADIEKLAIERSAKQRIAKAREALKAERDLAIMEFNKSEEAKTMKFGERISERAKIERDFARKTAREIQRIETEKQAEIANIALGNANKIAGGVTDIFKGDTVGAQIGGFGGIAGAVVGPQAQAVFDNIGGIVDTVGGLFGAGEDLAAQEEERMRQIKLTLELIKKEKEFQQELLRLERERVKLASTDAERQIRVNNLLIDDEQLRNEANQKVLTDLLSLRAQALGLPGDQPEDIAQFIGAQERAAVDDEALRAVVQRLRDNNINAAIRSLLGSDSASLTFDPTGRGRLDRIIEGFRTDVAGLEGLSPEARAAANQMLSILDESRSINIERDRLINEQGSAFGTGVADPDVSARIQQIEFRSTEFRTQFDALADLLNNQELTVQGRLEDSEEVLGLLERLRGLQDQASASSQEILELGREREASFIDTSRRAIVDRGTAIQRLNLEGIGLQGGLQELTVGVEKQRSFQERTADALESLDTKATDRNDLLGQILQAIIDSSGSALAQLNAASGQGIGGKL